MTRHEMKLRPLPFEQIASGTKTIEARLYDEKRQLVQLDDEIQFTNTDTNETIDSLVVGLLHYASFRNMFTYQDPRQFGFDQGDTIILKPTRRGMGCSVFRSNYLVDSSSQI